jgi:hypothetical protein
MCSLDFVRELDEPDRVAGPAPYTPGEIRRIDREAVAADTGARSEPKVSERLRRRRVDRAPDVDADRRWSRCRSKVCTDHI